MSSKRLFIPPYIIQAFPLDTKKSVQDKSAESTIATPDIIKRVGYEIDKSIKHDLSGIVTHPIESIGVVHNLPVTLAPGCTIFEDFVIVDHSKPMRIFSNSLLKKYRRAID
jgi:hypothetical protein